MCFTEPRIRQLEYVDCLICGYVKLTVCSLSNQPAGTGHLEADVGLRRYSGGLAERTMTAQNAPSAGLPGSIILWRTTCSAGTRS